MTLSAANFNAANCTIKKTFKELAAYQICQGTDYAVIKGDGGAYFGTKHVNGTGQGAQYGQQARAQYTNTGNTPQLKKSVRIMADIIGYITQEANFSVTTLTFQQAKAWCNKLDQKGDQFQDAAHKDNVLHAYVWFLMPVYNNLADFSCLKKSEPLSNKAFFIKNYLQKEPAVFEGLGRIIVADLFFGVIDRFAVSPSNWNGCDWANIGNIFITWSPIRFLGLDFVDTQTNPWGMMLGIPWATCKEKMKKDAVDAFMVLKKGNVKQRNQLAKIAIGKLGEKTHIKGNDKMVKAFRNGVRTGRNRLHDYYSNRINQTEWSRGLEGRFRALGW